MTRVLAALTILLLGGCQRRPAGDLPFTHDAYIWQRLWTDSLRRALHEATPAIHTWRVLVGEMDARGNLTRVNVDWDALRASGRPMIGVVRTKSLLVDRVLGDWPVNGLEVDYDCATSQLGAYRFFLHELRRKMKAGWTLSITALPSWMESGELAGVLGEVDEAVLQVHSVMNAQKGLFAKDAALAWAKQWAEKSPARFRIALPTYWSRVSWSADGRVSAIESEVGRYGSDEGESRELFVDPGEVGRFVSALKRTPLRGCEGIAWFRLPTGEDERAWSMATWRTVMAGKTPAMDAVIRVKETQHGVKDLYVANQGAEDGRLPAEVAVAAQGCAFADAMEPYGWQREAAGGRFRLERQGGVLKAGQERMVGWVRCTGKEFETRVSF